MARRKKRRSKKWHKKIQKKLGVSLMNYLFMSLITFVANIATMTYCHEVLGWDKRPAYFAALFMVFLVTFIGLRYVVYPDTRMNLKKQFRRYLVASGLLWAVEYWMFVYLAVRINYDYRTVIVMLTLAACAIRYVVLRQMVFKKR